MLDSNRPIVAPLTGAYRLGNVGASRSCGRYRSRGLGRDWRARRPQGPHSKPAEDAPGADDHHPMRFTTRLVPLGVCTITTDVRINEDTYA